MERNIATESGASRKQDTGPKVDEETRLNTIIDRYLRSSEKPTPEGRKKKRRGSEDGDIQLLSFRLDDALHHIFQFLLRLLELIRLLPQLDRLLIDRPP